MSVGYFFGVCFFLFLGAVLTVLDLTLLAVWFCGMAFLLAVDGATNAVVKAIKEK